MSEDRRARHYLEVVETASGTVVKRIDVSGKSERAVERIMAGILTNMSDRYFVREATVTADRRAIKNNSSAHGK